MDMLRYVLLLLVGFVLLIKGADFFVDGSSSVARLLKIPSIIIGLTVVALGTSAPEAAVSISAALKGANEIALSNIIGSNMFNLLMVIGICAIIKPILVSKDLYKRDFPLCILFTIIVTLMVLDRQLQRFDGIIMLIAFVAFMFILTKSALKSRKQAISEEDTSEIKAYSPLKSFILIAVGLIGIAFGGQIVVDNACNIASLFGLSQTLIGLTIVACGTSLPELVTSIVAAGKGENDLALGNVVGSNIFNLLFILGISATIHPIGGPGNLIITNSLIDLIILSIVTILFFVLVWTKKTVNRWEGASVVIIYLAYLVYIIIR